MELKGLNRQTVDVDGVKFVIRPQTYSDLTYAAGKAFSLDLAGGSRAGAFVIFPLIRRIESWEGVTMDGEPLPCTMDNLELFFGQHPEFVDKILSSIRQDTREAEEEKNFEASRSGSGSGTEIPDSVKRADNAE